jgi:hypothetical protein
VNRGVELSGEVVDSPQAVITAQLEAGVVVRMAVLYELLASARETEPAFGRPEAAVSDPARALASTRAPAEGAQSAGAEHARSRRAGSPHGRPVPPGPLPV